MENSKIEWLETLSNRLFNIVTDVASLCILANVANMLFGGNNDIVTLVSAFALLTVSFADRAVLILIRREKKKQRTWEILSK